MSFVHLHNHSEYSLLDGLPKVKKMISAAKDSGMEAIALTDHGVMHGIIEFYKEAKAANIKPILGMEGYVTRDSHKKRDGRENLDNNHITLLARNFTGYQNLMKISSIAHLEGFYYRPRVDHDTLKQLSQGIICLSGCPKGELASAVKEGDLQKARKVIEWHLEVFGEENYFLEVQRHEYASFITPKLDSKIRSNLEEMSKFESMYLKQLEEFSTEYGIPLVATNDAHYAKGDDAFTQDVLVCIATGKNVSETNRLRYVDTPTFYLRPEIEMKSLFPDHPEALETTTKIAAMCETEITLGKWFFPKFDLPEDKTADEALKELVFQKLPERIPVTTTEINKRIEYELEIIAKKGYSAYFLIVEDFMSWAQAHGIVTNTRGSAAGSLVSYIIGVTTVNPITYYLPFERFLNPYRPSPPDIDFDVADNRRDEIINYLVSRYGKEKVAQICTFGRMLARAAVRDVARVLGYPYAAGDRIAKLIPLGSQGFPMTIERALKESVDLKTLYDTDADARRIIDVGQTIEGNARHLSVHAAGVVVAPTALTDFTPLLLDPTSQEKTITQYEMHACEDVGLIKFDVLGIRNLSILGAAIDIVQKSRDIKIDLGKIPLTDKRTFDMLARGETMGTFQLGGSGMTRYLKELKPTRVEDLMAMVALFRPGPMAVIPEYIARKHNPTLVKYLDPRMEKYLDKSYGLLVYQDDLLFTAIYLAGYSWEEADKFRKAVGKKIPAEMAKQKEKFIEGVIKNGREKEFAEKLWILFEPFQAYGFNKAHAASYGIVAYYTAYMKANYPVEFMCALLTAESGDAEKISQAVEECRKMRVVVEAPHINKSDVGFTIEPNPKSLEGKAIRFGLSAVKNVGEAAITSILNARKDGDFKSLTDFCRRVGGQKVNRKVLESLIKSGSLDLFGKRAAQLGGLDKIRSSVDKKSKDKAAGQGNLFDDETSSSDLEYKDDLPQIEEFPKNELLAAEKELLGFYLSEHPLTDIMRDLKDLVSHRISEITAEESVGKQVRVGGIISSLRILLTKKDAREMAFGKIEDLSGSIEVTIFPKTFEANKASLFKDNAVVVFGKVDYRDDQLSIVADKIYPAKGLKYDEFENAKENKLPGVYEISIPKGTPPQTLLSVSRTLQENKGLDKVVLIFENGASDGKRVMIPYGINFTPNLKKDILSLLG